MGRLRLPHRRWRGRRACRLSVKGRPCSSRLAGQRRGRSGRLRLPGRRQWAFPPRPVHPRRRRESIALCPTARRRAGHHRLACRGARGHVRPLGARRQEARLPGLRLRAATPRSTSATSSRAPSPRVEAAAVAAAVARTQRATSALRMPRAATAAAELPAHTHMWVEGRDRRADRHEEMRREATDAQEHRPMRI